MTTLSEDRVYLRHARRRGAVLIVGAGAVGGLLAQELAPMGISPLWLVDYDHLEPHNLVRHPLGAEELGQSKATALATRIRRDFPLCQAMGIQADFLNLPTSEQQRLVSQADVVVAATDTAECQRRVNEMCLKVEKPAVYPGIWVDERVRDAEVGEILWVLPGRHTPCYECAVAFRRGAADAQAARGARVDIQLVSLATAQVVSALLDPADERSAILLDPASRHAASSPERTALYLHGLTPVSPGIRPTFPGPELQNRRVRIPFPATPCPACGGQEEARPQPPDTIVQRRGEAVRRRASRRRFAFAAAGVVLLMLLVGSAINRLTDKTGSALPTGTNVVAAGNPGLVVTVDPPEASAIQVQAPPGGITDASISPQDMTDACRNQYSDPSATAKVVETSQEWPSDWIKCFDATGINVGGVSLDEYCNTAYPGARAQNADKRAPEAWANWRCTGP